MNTTVSIQELTRADIEQLLREVVSYLAVVDAFRAAGAEPRWVSEELPPEWWLAEWTTGNAASGTGASVAPSLS